MGYGSLEGKTVTSSSYRFFSNGEEFAQENFTVHFSTYKISVLLHSNLKKIFSAKKTEFPISETTQNIRKPKKLRYQFLGNGVEFSKNGLFLPVLNILKQ